MIWKLIREFMKDTEHANNIRFEDSAWQRAKRLDTDIQAAFQKEWDELVRASDALHDEQDARIRKLEDSLRTIKEHTRLTSNETTLGTATKRLIKIWDVVEKVLGAEDEHSTEERSK